MTQITKIDRAAANEISKATEAALKAVAEQFGINVSLRGGKFDPASGTFSPKVEFSVEGAERLEWENTVHLIRSNWGNQWLHKEDFGAVITANGGKKYELVGINLRAPKFPINARCLNDGKTYKLTEDGVRYALGRTAPTQSARV